MPVDVNAVVDRFLSLGHDAGRPLTHIEVQKLLFFLEGWHLAIVGDRLFDEDSRLGQMAPSSRQFTTGCCGIQRTAFPEAR